MKEDWKECKLGEVLTIKYGKNQKEVESPNGTIPIYGTGGLMGYATKFLYDKPSILIGRKGTINKVKFIDKPFWTVDTLFYSIINEEIVSPKFLYYQLSLINFMNYNEGTTIPSLRTETLNRIEVSLPPLATQQKIATILSSLDDKIELNNKINDNLEQQAQAIFKSWFVDFEPFGGKMPEGWKVGKLSDLITIKYGKDHKKLDDGKHPVYGSGGIMRYVDKFLYDKESVLIPRKGTLNNVFYINEPFWSVDTMFYTEMKKENIAKYVYFFVKGKDLNSMNAGSAVPSMTTEILNAIEVVIPSDEYLEKFENIVSPMFKQIKQCIIENENLASIRDTLLQKLMNGEIEV